MIRVHHLNCATMCPRGQRAISGEGSWWGRGHMVCHCLLVETAAGLVLVDSGLGTAECREPHRLDAGFRALTGPRLDLGETAHAQVQRLGFAPQDVRHVVLTHLDLDHAGGIADFPWATVHVHARELAAARARASLLERRRYVASQWAHGPRWQTYDDAGDAWHGLRAVRLLEGLEDLALVPLFGHTRGHSGVAVREGDRWWLHAGDAYFHHGELEPTLRCPPGLSVFQAILAMDGPARLDNRERLRALAREHGAAVRVFSAHDPLELDRAHVG